MTKSFAERRAPSRFWFRRASWRTAGRWLPIRRLNSPDHEYGRYTNPPRPSAPAFLAGLFRRHTYSETSWSPDRCLIPRPINPAHDEFPASGVDVAFDIHDVA